MFSLPPKGNLRLGISSGLSRELLNWQHLFFQTRFIAVLHLIFTGFWSPYKPHLGGQTSNKSVATERMKTIQGKTKYMISIAVL